MTAGPSRSAPTPVVLVVQHEPDTGPGWFAGWLADSGLSLQIVHPYDGGGLGDLPAYDGLLVLGGAMGPSDDAACPWLPDTRELLAQAVAAAIPTLGICLGAELLALGCGGEVRRGLAGPELGVLGLDRDPAAAQDPVFAALPVASRVLQWHWEEISVLPPGSVRLASSPTYRNQAFRVGRAAWGVQGHPEVTGDIAARWACDDVASLRSAGVEPDLLVAQVRAAQHELVATWAPLAAAFAAVVHEFHDREGR